MKTAQIDHEFHHKAQLPTSCDNFIFTDWFYKLTSSLSTNNCNKEEFKVLTGNHKHWEWIEPWFSTFISLIGLIRQVEFNNRRVKSNTSQQSSRAFHLTWTSTQSSSDLKVFHQKFQCIMIYWIKAVQLGRKKRNKTYFDWRKTRNFVLWKTFEKCRMFKASIYSYLCFN